MIHIFRHRSTSVLRELQTPTHRRLVIVLAGVIAANSSEISIGADSMFTSNSASSDGGETRRGTGIDFIIVLAGRLRKVICSDIGLHTRYARDGRQR